MAGNKKAELRRLLGVEASAYTASVVGVRPGGTVVVTSTQGTITLHSTLALAAGDEVLIEQGSIVAKVKPTKQLPVHYV